MYSKFMIDKRNHKKTKTSRSFSACKNYNTNNSNVRTDDPNFFNELRRIRHKVHMRMKLKCHTSGIPTKRDVESEFKLNPYFASKSSIQSATANPDIKINQRKGSGLNNMKKTILALAVPALLAAGVTNAATVYNNDGTKIDLKGSIRLLAEDGASREEFFLEL